MKPTSVMLLALLWSSPAAFGVSFCNYSNSDVDCAVVGYDPTSGFVTSGGWYHSTNGTCTGDVDISPITTPFGYYCFNSALVWGSGAGSYCVESSAFTFYKAGDATACSAAGGTMVTFGSLGGGSTVTLDPQ